MCTDVDKFNQKLNLEFFVPQPSFEATLLTRARHTPTLPDLAPTPTHIAGESNGSP